MKELKEYSISFTGLKLGKHHFDYKIKNSFFQIFEFDEFEDVEVNVDLFFEKKTTMLELLFKHKGFVKVPCDVSNELFDLPIEGELKLIVQFGEEFNDENEELLIIPFAEHQINVAQYIYEMIVLSVPVKRIHPDYIDEYEEEDEIEDLFFESELEIEQEEENKTENDTDTDPRWEKLKQLLTDK